MVMTYRNDQRYVNTQLIQTRDGEYTNVDIMNV